MSFEEFYKQYISEGIELTSHQKMLMNSLMKQMASGKTIHFNFPRHSSKRMLSAEVIKRWQKENPGKKINFIK